MLRQVRSSCSHAIRPGLYLSTFVGPLANPKLRCCHEFPVRNSGVEMSHIEQGTLANRFFDTIPP